MEVEEFMKTFILKLTCLANVLIDKCSVLGKRKTSEDENTQCAHMLRVLRRVQRNVESFEGELLDGIAKYNISLSSETEQTQDINISIRSHSNHQNIQIPSAAITNFKQFETDLKAFLENYVKNQTDNTQDSPPTTKEDQTDSTSQVEPPKEPNENIPKDFHDESWTDSVELAMEKLFNENTTQTKDTTDKEIIREKSIENITGSNEATGVPQKEDIVENASEIGNVSVPEKETTKLQDMNVDKNTPGSSEAEHTTSGENTPLEIDDAVKTPEVSGGNTVDDDSTALIMDISENTREPSVPEDNSEAEEERSISQIMDLVEKTQEISEDGEEKRQFFSVLGMSKVDNYDATKRIQNELMYVTSEVPYESEETPIKSKKNEENPEETCNEDMNTLLEWFEQEESDADSESSESSDSNTVVYSEPEINEIIAETGEKKNVQDFKPADCYVKLERMKVIRITYNTDDEKCSSYMSTSSESGRDRRINNLCNLSNLENPKKRKYKGSILKRKIKRRRKEIIDLPGSETTDLSGYESVSEGEIDYTLQEIRDVKSPEVDPNEILTQIIADLTHSTDDENLSSVDTEDTETPKIKREKNISNNNNKKPDKQAENVDDWRNDPLLKQRFDFKEKEKSHLKDNGKRKQSDSDDSEFFRRRKRFPRLDNDWLNASSSNSESSDSDEDVVIREENIDSDCEIVDCSGAVPFDVKLEAEHDKLRGRKNILSVLSTTSLHEETQRAGKEEEERVMRLEKRLQLKLSQSQENIPKCIVLDTTKDGYEICVDEALSQRAYSHQIDGLKFMWNACYENVDDLKNMEGTGCILAHSMGLGKTFQVFMLVHTLFRHSITGTNHVLIVCPLSTVAGWLKEFENGYKIAKHKINTGIFTIESTDTTDVKQRRVLRWKEKKGILIVGYEAFEKMTNPKMKDVNRCEKLREALMNPGPDLVVCDEGHLLKNGKTLRTKALMQVRTKRRIALTGTPLQNNLTEYYHMVQFVKPNLLGTKHEFHRQFSNPIMNGQYEDSSEVDIQIMKKRSHVLHRLLKNTVQRFESNILKQYLSSMQDYALFIQLHPVQEKLYKMYIEMVQAKRRPTDKKMKTFFADYQVSKYICSHPFLLYMMETQNLRGQKKIVELDTISEEPEVQEVEGVPPDWFKSECTEDIRTDLEFGTKLSVMMGIIEEAEKIKEKVLIFTSSLVELNSIEYFLKLKGTSECPSWKSKQDYFRMDGTVPPQRRTQMCDWFNNPKNTKLRVFLMSHKVGGLGLNLVAANRVILLGANFNPSYDLQSIYRVYRFGQEKPVYIYRLLSMGTMEEKIYNRCVSKLAIASRVVDKHQTARHYKNLDLDDLYTINVDLSLQRSTPAKPDDDLLSNVLLKYECIYKYHHHQKLLENRPDEDLNEEDKIKAWEEFKLFSGKEFPVILPTTNPSVVTGSKCTPTVGPVATPGYSSSVRNILESRVDQLYPLGRKTPYNPNIMADVQKYLNNNQQPTTSTSRNNNLVQNPCAQLSKENVETIRKVPPIRIKLPTETNATRVPEILKSKVNNTERQWRASSSDDFQKPPDFTVVPVRNKRTSCISNKPNEGSVEKKQNNFNNDEPVIIQDDDDVILVSSTVMPPTSSSMLRKAELEETVNRLNKFNITVRNVTKTSDDDDLIILT